MREPTDRHAVSPGRARLLAVFVLSCAMSFPTVATARGVTRPADPDAWNQRLELGPVDGFTTIWHPAPVATAVPLGATLRFRTRLPGTGSVQWAGAVEVERTAWSIAEVTLEMPGAHRVAMRIPDGTGGVIEEAIELDIRALPPGGVTISPISITVNPVDLSRVPSNSATLRHFFRDESIAQLTEVAADHYRTSMNRWMTLSASVEPAAFAPLVEWRLDGVAQRHLGAPVRLAVFAARSFEIAAGPGEPAPAVRLDTYRVRITSHARRTRIPDETAVTFTAVTDPPGHESEISWLASTKHGTAVPLTGRGPEFTTLFLSTVGEEGDRWLGVKADAAKVAQDESFPNLSFGDDGTEEVAVLTARPDVLCGDETTHRLEVLWETRNAQEPKVVEIIMVLGSGDVLQLGGGTSGAVAVPIRAPRGDSAVLFMRTGPANGEPDGPGELTRVAQTAALFPPCFQIEVPPPGQGFEPGDTPFGGTGSGVIREVDVVTFDVAVSSDRRFVTSVGSGAAYQLTSWRSPEDGEPVPMDERDSVSGFDVRLHGLMPELGLPASYPVVAASRRSDGNLWLSLYGLDDAGSLVLHDTVGYGANAGVEVEAYGIAHRSFERIAGSEEILVFQVITPVRTRTGDVRMLVWEVRGATREGAGIDFSDLELRGVQDSGPLASANFDSPIEAAYLGADLFVVTVQSDEEDDDDPPLQSQFWEITTDGEVFFSSQGESGVRLDGGGPVTEPLVDVAVAPLESGGYVTATSSDPMDRGELVVWDVFRFTGPLRDLYDTFFLIFSGFGFPPPPPIAFPYRMTDNREDLSPDAPGVDIDGRPTLKNGTDGTTSLVAQALLTDALWERAEPGAGDLFTQKADDISGIASVTKVMTLILALEDVHDRHVQLDDLVIVGPGIFSLPRNTSRMGIGLGEVWELEDLLNGLILASGGDAAIAIAQGQIAPDLPLFFDTDSFFPTFGRADFFVARMNHRAYDLGMHDTDYGRAFGTSNSTPRDQMRLMLHGLFNVPEFRTIMGRRSIDAESDGLFGRFSFIPLEKGDNGYPGLVAFKGGSRGGKHQGFQRCGDRACLAAAVTRLGRTMIVTLQQSGDILGDASDLFDYGFRQQFTPDLRADDGGVAGPADEFAIDRLRGTEVVSAVVDGGRLEVCLWLADAGEGRLQRTVCGSQPAPSLEPGPPITTPKVELIRMSTEEAAGDYLRGFLRDGILTLDLWRIAPRRRPDGGFVPVG